MIKSLPFLLFFTFLFCFSFSPVSANPISDSTSVSASVPAYSVLPPNLFSPANNLASNSARFTFEWTRPSPLPVTTLNHYDLYIDNAVYAPNIPDSLTSSDFYFYTATATSGHFYIALKQDLAQGYHTWKVSVTDDAGTTATTGNWTFYIDSIVPFISLTKIDAVNFTWNTAVSGSIPEEASRYLNLTSTTPTLKGNVETNANFKLNVNCPSSPPSGCTSQTWTINSTDGNWEKQLSPLFPNIYYSVILSATDATNNSTVFPTFYLKYTSISATTSLTPTSTTPGSSVTPTSTSGHPLTPVLTPTPPENTISTLSGQLKPPPELSALITPTPFLASPPPAPSIPPQKTTSRVTFGYGPYLLLVFLCIGLPTHLLLTTVGVSAKLKEVLNFLFVLGFPFLRKKNSTTAPFSFLSFYDPAKLSRPLYRTISDINGHYFIPTHLPSQLFTILTNTNLAWKNQIVSLQTLNSSCLLPLPKRPLTVQNTLQNNLFNLRSIPLVIAILSSSVGLYFFPNAYLFSYLYLSLQYSFSEYYYPKLSK